MDAQPSLFASGAEPEGFCYRPELIGDAEERAVAEWIASLPLRPFEFRSYTGQRRVASFGWHYDFTAAALRRTADIPSEVLPVREKLAAFAGLAAEELPHLLVTEYSEGAPIGWHKDRPQFGKVIGLSLLSPCVFRFRRKAGTGWERFSLTLEPRSAYLLDGPARTEWEHSIPGVQRLRYSMTFRTLR